MKVFRHCVLIVSATVVTGCATSPFSTTWKSPDATPVSLSGKKVLAVVQVKDEARRREAEDLLAADLTRRGAVGVASYTLFPASASEPDQAAAKAAAEKAGVAGVVIVRFGNAEQVVTSTPNPSPRWINDPYYRRAWDYMGRGWGTVYQAETVRTDTKLAIETRVYSLEQEKLIWAGTSEAWNPKKSSDVIKTLTAAVAKNMTEAGVLVP